jgi:hypothetical protein
MIISIEQLTEAVPSFPNEARALLADRLAESLDPLQALRRPLRSERARGEFL